MGLHAPDELEMIARKDIGALANILGDGQWFLSDRPSMADATVYSLLSNILWVPFKSPMKAMIESHENLVPWLNRFREEIYPEFTPQN